MLVIGHVALKLYQSFPDSLAFVVGTTKRTVYTYSSRCVAHGHLEHSRLVSGTHRDRDILVRKHGAPF